MKQFKCLLLLLFVPLLLGMQARAAECTMVVEADGAGCRECALGDLAADALRWYAQADIALVPADELGIGLQPGPVDEASLSASFPGQALYVRTELSRQQVKLLLEQCLSHITLGADERIDESASAWSDFCCVSGLRLSYDASAPVGARLYSLETDADRDTLTVVLPVRFGQNGEEIGTLRDAVRAYAADRGELSPPESERIKALGANDSPIIGGMIPKGAVLVLAVLMIGFGGMRWRKAMRERTER